MRSSDWSSDVCSSDLYNSASNAVADRVRSARPSPPQQTIEPRLPAALRLSTCRTGTNWPALARQPDCQGNETGCGWRERQSAQRRRSEEHTSELQPLMRISHAVSCLKRTTPSITYNKTAHE